MGNLGNPVRKGISPFFASVLKNYSHGLNSGRIARISSTARSNRQAFKSYSATNRSTTQKYTHASIRQLMDIYDKSHPHA
jgi:hypothetical protein